MRSFKRLCDICDFVHNSTSVFNVHLHYYHFIDTLSLLLFTDSFTWRREPTVNKNSVVRDSVGSENGAGNVVEAFPVGEQEEG